MHYPKKRFGQCEKGLCFPLKDEKMPVRSLISHMLSAVKPLISLFSSGKKSQRGKMRISSPAPQGCRLSRHMLKIKNYPLSFANLPPYNYFSALFSGLFLHFSFPLFFYFLVSSRIPGHSVQVRQVPVRVWQLLRRCRISLLLSCFGKNDHKRIDKASYKPPWIKWSLYFSINYHFQNTLK